MLRSALSFWLRHWRGQCSLGVAFWLNFVTLTIVVYALQRHTRAALADDPASLFYLLLAQFVVFRLLVYPWQLVGALRACERTLKGLGEPFWPRTFQVVLALSVVLVFLDGLTVLRAGYGARSDSVVEDGARQHPFRLHAGNTVVHLQGYLDFGATAELRDILASHAGIVAVVLDSRGGQVYEARGLARLIKDRSLDTYSTRECSSACVTAFAAGRQRWLAPEAKLGFHRYRLDAHYRLPHVEEHRELRKDLEFFEAQLIDVTVLGRVFETPSHEIGYPSHGQLLESGMIHGFARAPLDERGETVPR